MFVNIRLLRVDGDAIDLKPPAPERVRRTVSTVLNSTELCAWATVSPEGHAHINTGYFAHSDELVLYLLSHPESLHCRNLAVNASMAAAIYASAQGWADPGRGLQLFGACAQAADIDRAEAERVYSRRFSQYSRWKATLDPAGLPSEYRFYRFAPARLKILDEAEFGDAVFVEADITRT
jgi:uncharacterized protein YhbP (UPF0306 family)